MLYVCRTANVEYQTWDYILGVPCDEPLLGMPASVLNGLHHSLWLWRYSYIRGTRILL
jgi:hypothetical protein